MGAVVVTPYTDEDIEDLRKQIERRRCRKLEKLTDSGRIQWRERFRPLPTAILTLLMSYAHAIFLTDSLSVAEIFFLVAEAVRFGADLATPPVAAFAVVFFDPPLPPLSEILKISISV